MIRSAYEKFSQFVKQRRSVLVLGVGLSGVIAGPLGGYYLFHSPSAAAANRSAASATPCRTASALLNVRTDLFFGKSIPGGGTVTDAQFFGFLDQEVTPRFPDGLTVVPATGQFLESNGTLDHEGSDIVILLYPLQAASSANQKIEEIRAAYDVAFRQESVLRVDERPTCVSF
jgi:hypothetical protein